MIFRAFDAAEVGPVRGAVHLGMPVGVHRAAILGQNGVPEPPADPTGLAGFPGPDGRLGDARREELRVLGRLHDAVLRDLVIPLRHDGRRVGVGGVEDHLAAIDAGEAVADELPDPFEDRGLDRDEVAGDQDRLIDDLVPLP